MWRHYPWMIGLLLAPIWFGAVGPEGQSAVGLLLGGSLLLCSFEAEAAPVSRRERFGFALLFLVLMVPLIPLPVAMVQWLSPERVKLAQAFPVDAGGIPAWLTLTISPASTVQRLWQLLLLLCGFQLARRAASWPDFAPRLAWIIGITVALLAASDVWYRCDGQRALLGIRETAWGKGAGTFANRNHFADWLYVGSLFCAGVVLRALWPLRSARTEHARVGKGKQTEAILVGGAILFGLVMAVLSGSRGGAGALAVGAAVWLGLVAHRSRNRGRLVLLGVVGIGLLVALLLAGESLFARLAEARADLGGRYPKVGIWRESLRMFSLFPVFGTGWGTFVTAFNHYKSFGGDATFWHAENDYVQWLVEGGLAGVIVTTALLGCLLRKPLALAWRGRLEEPELVFGALAALAAFASHALIEFVFQITANALLAAVLLGWLVGQGEQGSRAAVPPPPSKARGLFNLAWAVVIMAVAGLQATSWWHWDRGSRDPSLRVATEEIAHSLKEWPWETKRHRALLRAQVSSVSALPKEPQALAAQEFRRQFDDTLRRDPFNWELRLERAWLDVTFATNNALIRAEVLRVVALNSLQPQIPLRFAGHFIDRDPDFAARLIRQAKPVSPNDLKVAYEISWQLFHRPTELWELTADTVPALLALSDFAFDHQLPALAAQACERLKNRVDGVVLAEKFLKTERGDLALEVLPQPPAKPAEKLLAARAYLQLQRYAEAIRVSETLWKESKRQAEILTPTPGAATLATAMEDWRSQPKNARRARELGELIFQQAAQIRDLKLLRDLVQNFPADPRLIWLLYRTELDQGQELEAAQMAVRLATMAIAG